MNAMSEKAGRWAAACVCGRPIEGHKGDEIHDAPVSPPLEDHEEWCTGNTMPVYVSVSSGRCTICERRVSSPKVAVSGSDILQAPKLVR